MPYILLILTTLFWSGNFVLSRGMHADIPPLALSFWRWIVAIIILAPFGMKHFLAQKDLIRRNYRFIATQGLLGVTGFNSLVYLALQSTTAINAVLLCSCIPVIIVLISWLLYGERIRPRQCLGVGISLTGVLLIISGGEPATLVRMQFNRGDLLVFLAAIFWAFYSTNLRKYPRGLHPLAYQTGIMLVGLCALTPLYGLEMLSGKSLVFSRAALTTIIYVALFASVLAFIFWNRAVTALGANVAGPFIHLMPVFSTVLAVAFLGEAFTRNHLTSICLIFGGILLTSNRRGTSGK
jgi:drug/metabolite transporter (DMT)-like permease